MKMIDDICILSPETAVDISGSLGAPFGGFGTGYFVYGRHGFVNWNVSGFPETKQTFAYPFGDSWDYETENPDRAPIALYLETGGGRTLLQADLCSFLDGDVCRDFFMHADMPLGEASMTAGDGTEVSLLLYSSIKPHDLEKTCTPACVFRITVKNTSQESRTYRLGLGWDSSVFTARRENGLLVLKNADGETAFGFMGTDADTEAGTAEITLAPNASAVLSAALGWYYPEFYAYPVKPGESAPGEGIYPKQYGKESGWYQRNYVSRFDSASSAVKTALAESDAWKAEIDRWHESIGAPQFCRHIWFGSVSSMITSTFYTAEGYYFEIEQPHQWLNTMDVSVYSTWFFMVNWPEAEHADLSQYYEAIPLTGENAGRVYHSLWNDASHYVEESIFALRIWRYALWSGDREFLKKGFPYVRAALEYQYRTDGRGHLINNPQGNQSYDAWKMPGIGVYVNVQWIYALFAFRKMCSAIGEPEVLAGIPLDTFLHEAVREYNEVLRHPDGYWRAYVPNEDSLDLPFGDAVFSDQLFGHWAVTLDRDSRSVLDTEQEKEALLKIYVHNRLEDTKHGYSVWLNGMLPDRAATPAIDTRYPDNDWVRGYHGLTAWVSTEMNLASMLGYFGYEKESLDVFSSVSRGMGKNVLAVGEYNRGVNEKMEVVACPPEPGKDTPRFPAYPRYKSSWEYLVRMLGMETDFDTVSLHPFRTVSLHLDSVILAGMTLTVTVEEGWNVCYVNGVRADPILDRKEKCAVLAFVKEMYNHV